MKREAHVAASIGLAGVIAIGTVVHPATLLVAAGALSGVLLHPDLDLGHTPYGWLRKHRGLSHWPVIGTLDRLLWFVGPVLLAWALAGKPIDWSGLALWAVGLVLSDLVHILLDRRG